MEEPIRTGEINPQRITGKHGLRRVSERPYQGTCITCGERFEVEPGAMDIARFAFCCPECKAQFDRKMLDDPHEGKFRTIQGLNEDSYGYDFINMVWRGAAEIRPGIYVMVEFSGENGLAAMVEARKNEPISEDGVSTGDVCLATPPALGTEPKRSKDAKKQGGQVIRGEKENDGDEE